MFELKWGKVEGFEGVGREILGVVRARVDEEGGKMEMKEKEEDKEGVVEEKKAVDVK